MFESASENQLRASVLADPTRQGNDNDMGLHLYFSDEVDRGTDWDCTKEEMLRYAVNANAEPK